MTPERRGACPTLRKPMETGDGLLARLHPRDRRLTVAELHGLCEAASRFGNGLVEITGRGSLQVRGLLPDSVEPFAEAVEALGIEEQPGSAVETSPIAGLDARELVNPAPLVDAIRKGMLPLASRLAPKVSITVDGGGALPLSHLPADLRLTAKDAGWVLTLAGRSFGPFSEEEAGQASLRVLSILAEAGCKVRGRDLGPDSFGLPERPLLAGTDAVPPIGRFALIDGGNACGFVLPFGLAEASHLKAFSEALAASGEIRLAPGYGFLVLGAPEEGVRLAAERLSFISSADDPRLRISACAGAPSCRSGRLRARDIAERLSHSLPAVHERVHVSGCEKECARPLVAHVELVATGEGCDIREARMTATPRLRDTLLRLAREGDERNRECR